MSILPHLMGQEGHGSVEFSFLNISKAKAHIYMPFI